MTLPALTLATGALCVSGSASAILVRGAYAGPGIHSQGEGR